jgi:ABC-type bacteriocin/lantibiotic exporter with double-glycine peptidase domain
MLLSYFGVPKSERDIRLLLKMKPAGTNPLNVVRLREWNLEASVTFSNLEELKSYLVQKKPPIVLLWSGKLNYWDSNEYLDYLHAVVVIGYDDEMILINDPAFSDHPKTIQVYEFLEAWSYSQQMLILIENAQS